jgi:4-phytase/acid phosphatase
MTHKLQRRALRLVTLLTAALLSAGAPWSAMAAERAKLEQVVILMRHGVRPPTKAADALAPLADRPWPGDEVWGAKPGELTPHGAAAVRRLGADLRRRYAALGLLPSGRLDGAVGLWADSGDQRTRESARALGEGLSPGAPVAYASRPAGQPDPLFNGAGSNACPISPAEALKAVQAREPLETPATRAALARLQAIVAPSACTGGAGTCLEGADAASADERGIKLKGPLAVGAEMAEDLLLEYENGLPADAVGWGRMRREDLEVVMAAHVRTSELTRREPYVALRRGAPLAGLILDLLDDRKLEASELSGLAGRRLVVLVGHDTNLSNLAGAFGLDWSLPGQPDPTAPGVMLAFEKWRGPAGVELRVRILYQDPDQVRDLGASPAHVVEAQPAQCRGACTLAEISRQVRASLAAACPGR